MRGYIRQRMLKPLSIAAILPTEIYKKMKDVKVWTYIEATGMEKTTTLDPVNWDVKLFSYKADAGRHGKEVVLCGVEDWHTSEEADDWKEVLISMRKFIKKGGEEVLVIHIYYNQYYPGSGNRCRVWYKDKLIFDSRDDGWRKDWIEFPW